MFNLGLVPLFLIEHPIIALNPNHPKHYVMMEVPNLDSLNKALRYHFPKENLFSMEIVVVACSNPTKLMHDEGHPPPCSLGLDAIPKLMFN